MVAAITAAVPRQTWLARVQRRECRSTSDVRLLAGAVTLDPADVVVQWRVPENWGGAADDGETQVLLDGRITPELAREGMARDVVRLVQDLRKEAGLEMEDRIELYLASPDAELTAAIATYTSTIAAETLTVRWAPHDLDGEAARAEVKVDGKPLTVALRKVAR